MKKLAYPFPALFVIYLIVGFVLGMMAQVRLLQEVNEVFVNDVADKRDPVAQVMRNPNSYIHSIAYATVWPVDLYIRQYQCDSLSGCKQPNEASLVEEDASSAETENESESGPIALPEIPDLPQQLPEQPTPIPTLSVDTTHDMGVLVIKYFPVTKNNLIDIAVTGDVGEPYDVIRKRTEDVTSALKNALEKSSTYGGADNKDKNPVPALRYNIVDTKEHKQAVPIKARPGKPTYPDYAGIMNSHDICTYVTERNVKEVWLWAYQGPGRPSDGQAYLGISESKMSGPQGDISNSGRENDLPNCGKTYRVYTFNYQRSTSEALESWGHQMEAEMSAVDSVLFRNKFQGIPFPPIAKQAGRCGSVHNPPNARSEYDRANKTPYESDCLDWNPDSLGKLTDISCATWGCDDVDPVKNNASLNYQIWMFQHMPGKGNAKTYQGKQLRNWWDVHGDFDYVMKNNKRLTAQ